MTNPFDPEDPLKSLIKKIGSLALEGELERAQRLLRETQGLDRWETELRRFQYGEPAELARLTGHVDPSELARLAGYDAPAELARLAGYSPGSLDVSGSEKWLAEIAAVDTSSLFGNEIEKIHQFADAWRPDHFRLPGPDETDRLLADYARSSVTQWSDHILGSNPDLARALNSIRTPYLELENTLASISAISELQSISRSFEITSAFDPDLAPLLRDDLGDWRDKVSWNDVAMPASARIEMYVSRGFDRSLTHFPPAAFKEVLELTGLLVSVPEADGSYRVSEDTPDYADGIDVERNSQAYKRLLEFELYLRRFIDGAMTAQFGEDWARLRAPRDVYEGWLQRRELAMQAGMTEFPLIFYANFADYEKIISRKDNWRDIFAKYFMRPENIRESLQRLYPVRHCTMHARPVTREDELLMAVEIHRIVKAVKFR